ncbi:MAG: hypothetical protein RLZZ241_213 [Bacteroidota bacterium]|jgi:GNAT superfamily N-acetyltransferase
MIRIQEIHSREDLKTFVRFPFKLYRNSPFWVPPIIEEEINTFDQSKNPVFEHAEAHFFLAYRGNEIVGRIAAIINWQEVKQQGLAKMRFGWFDVIDDLEVSKALLQTVVEIGSANQLEYIEGPMGFSNLDKVGVLTEGFDHIGTMVTWYNHAYYKTHLEALGFVPEKEFIESKFPFVNADPKFFGRVADLVRDRYSLKSLKIKHKSELLPRVDEMFDLFNNSYRDLSSFVAISDAQKAYMKKKFMGFVDPEYIQFVVNKDNRMVGFAVVLPSFSKALQKAKGKLFPFGIFYLLWAKLFNKDAVFYLIGIHPEYQSKGVHAMIFKAYHEVFSKKGVKMCYRTPELADNIAIRQIWKNFDPKIYKRRKTYRKPILSGA